jgi:hypothetical protein
MSAVRPWQVATQADMEQLARKVGRDTLDDLVRSGQIVPPLPHYFARLLGSDCPPLPGKLFVMLAEAIGLRRFGATPHMVCFEFDRFYWTYAPASAHLLRGAEPVSFAFDRLWARERTTLVWSEEPAQNKKRFRARLRQVVKALNDRLGRRHVPLRVLSPRAGWLRLVPFDEVELIAALRAKDHAERREHARTSGREIVQRTKSHKRRTSRRRMKNAAVLCQRFLKEKLAGGLPKLVARIEEEWQDMGGSIGTLKRARSKMGVISVPPGPGQRQGVWSMLLLT